METWIDVEGYEGLYSVSDMGNVVRVDRGRTVTQHPDHNGRLRVSLCKDGKAKWHSVHRIVLLTFIGPCPPGMECLHDDGDHTNNKLTNLFWGTHVENMEDKSRHGTQRQGLNHPRAKLSYKDVEQIRASNEPQRVLADRYGVSQPNIHYIKTRKLWSHLN